jgi:F0F1-type ATP synthase membrane subunit b/b'
MKKKAHKSMAEDVDALFNGESLSEEFKTKATTIFEAAVNARIDTILEEMITENNKVLAEAVEEIQSQMADQVDEYLNYVVEQWMEQNQVAIETGLRAELVDDFIGGLKNLFAEHYIEIPEEKVDVAETLAARVAELEESVTSLASDADDKIAALTEELNVAKRNEAIRKICEGLTEVQVEKMKSLAEGVEFTTEGEFNNKLAVIRENYFPVGKVKSEVKALQETTVTEDKPEVEVHGLMKHYVQAISKTAPKA